MRYLPLIALLSALLTGCAAGPPPVPPGPTLQLSAGTARLGDPVNIRIESLPPSTEVRIRALRSVPRQPDRTYRSEALLIADADGEIDLASDAPLDGSWSRPDANGLFWSMRAIDGAPPPDLDPDEIWIELLDADNGSLLDAAVLKLPASPEPLVETPLGEGFPGAFVLRRPGSDPLPAIVLLGGSEGGDSSARRSAPMWASRGFAAVGYPYYSPAWFGNSQAVPGLPQGFANLPLDKLTRVRDALRARADIDCARIGLLGGSKGAEFVLAASSRIDGFAAVAAIVPSDVIWEGWGPGSVPGQTPGFSWKGESLPFVPYVGMQRAVGPVGDGERVAMRVPHAEGRAAHSERVEAARIRVEDIDEPVFVLGGGQDQVWDSGQMAAHIASTRAAAGLETEALIFARAGHAIGRPPQTPASAEDAQANAAAWPALVAFFNRNLKPNE